MFPFHRIFLPFTVYRTVNLVTQVVSMKAKSGMVTFCSLCWPRAGYYYLRLAVQDHVYFHGLDYEDVVACHINAKSIVSALAYRSDKSNLFISTFYF